MRKKYVAICGLIESLVRIPNMSRIEKGIITEIKTKNANNKR